MAMAFLKLTTASGRRSSRTLSRSAGLRRIRSRMRSCHCFIWPCLTCPPLRAPLSWRIGVPLASLQSDADRWTGVDDSAGEGIAREDIRWYLRFLVTVKLLPWPASRGSKLPPNSADVAQTQALWGSGWSWWCDFIMFLALEVFLFRAKRKCTCHSIYS